MPPSEYILSRRGIHFLAQVSIALARAIGNHPLPILIGALSI